MTQRVLFTDRIELVPLADEHLDFEVALNSDPRVMRYLDSGRPATRAETMADHLERLGASGPVPGLGYWVGLIDGSPVGWWGLAPPGDGHPAGSLSGQAPALAGLGYRLLPDHWRLGLAKEGAAELIRHGFEDLAVQRIYAETMAVNTASRATMASLGMRHVRTFHVHWDHPIPGTEHGEVEYAVTRQEWLER